MVEMNKIEVLNMFGLSFLLIRFRISDTVEDLNKYRFDIYRSNSPISGFEIIASNLDRFEFLDTGVNLYKASITYYYKVGARDAETDEYKVFENLGQLQYHEPDNIANTIIENYKVYMNSVVNNSDIYILNKRRFGQRCSKCWDDIRKQPRAQNCTTCYGTGYEGGYFSPIKTKMSYISGNVGIQQSVDMISVGESESPAQVWIQNYPIIMPGDLIVDALNNRFIVNSCQPTVKNGTRLRQILTIYKLPPADISYKFLIGE